MKKFNYKSQGSKAHLGPLGTATSIIIEKKSITIEKKRKGKVGTFKSIIIDFNFRVAKIPKKIRKKLNTKMPP